MTASGRGYTTADLHGLPDGRRWELIEGSLTVSPTGTIDQPWRVRVDLPQLIARRARMMRVDAG